MSYRRLYGLIFLIYLVPMTVLVWFVHHQTRAAQISAYERHLASVAQIQANRISTAIDQSMMLVRLISSRTKLRTELQKHLSDENSANLRTVTKILTDALNSVSKIVQLDVVSNSGKVLASATRARQDKTVPAKHLPMDYVEAQERISSVFTDNNGTLFLVFESLLISDGQVLGQLHVTVNAKPISSVSLDIAGLGDTGETLIGKRNLHGDAVFLAPVRHDKDAALNRVIPHTQTQVPMTRILNDIQDPVRELIDYHGTPVFAATQLVPKLNWGIVVKMDRQEVLQGLLTRLCIELAAIILIGIVISYVVARYVSTRLTELSQFTTQQIGKLHSSISPAQFDRPGDEITHLTQDVQSMVQHIKASKDELEKLVSQRTRSLQESNSALRTAQDALLHSTKLAAIGEISTGIAHEINQPLTAMKMKLERYRRQAKLNSDQALVDGMQEVLELINRISSTTEHLRNLGRRDQRQDRQSLSLLDAIRCSVELMREQLAFRKIQVQVPPQSDDHEIQGVSNQIEQVLINLLCNARDALENTKKPRIRISLQNLTGDEVSIRVEDNGPGISPDLSDAIFEAFFTTKQRDRGTGLGLAISRQLIEEHGGKLRVEQSEWAGAALVVSLPTH